MITCPCDNNKISRSKRDNKKMAKINVVQGNFIAKYAEARSVSEPHYLVLGDVPVIMCPWHVIIVKSILIIEFSTAQSALT